MNFKKFLLRFVKGERGSLASNIVGVILAMFIMGAVGGTAFVMASNVTLYAGCPTAVTVLMTVGVPVIAGIAIMLYMIPSRAVKLVYRFGQFVSVHVFGRC